LTIDTIPSELIAGLAKFSVRFSEELPPPPSLALPQRQNGGALLSRAFTRLPSLL
jgi:hypothetical protein